MIASNRSLSFILPQLARVRFCLRLQVRAEKAMSLHSLLQGLTFIDYM